jgi:acetyltransferase-like isoleucine patch superfamily enzyme
MAENPLRGLKNRLLAMAANVAPGAKNLRVTLHRWRGVRIGEKCFIGAEALIETSYPWLVWIGDNVSIGIRTTIIAHFRGTTKGKNVSVRIEDDVFIGPGVIILPNVTIGRGAVVNAGSVVTKSIPPMTMVQGNPAVPIATCGVPLILSTPLKEFYSKLRPIKKPQVVGRG